ncbi:MAG: hypothetical protein AAB225_23020, partial [Acidobacteriota bacterium]
MHARTLAALGCFSSFILLATLSVAQQSVVEKYKLRYGGLRWSVSFGSYEGVERFALDELQRVVQRFVPYVVEIRHAAEPLDREKNLILVGTRQNNPLIAGLVDKGLVSVPSAPQGYTVACFPSPWSAANKVAVIAGADPSGVLYGVQEFNKRLAALPAETSDDRRKAFDRLPEFKITESPVIENRGLWSWGYVIYDYKRYLDNMARLKMNQLIIWNDQPPLNSRQLIDYAHSRGIKVIFGFHWGWGIENLDPVNKEHLGQIKSQVIQKYERDYRPLGLDGIYFQSFTETRETKASGRTLASLACEWINEIGGALLQRYPDLRIEAGIHATSIMDNYPDLKPLNPKIQIMWEDAGVMPWPYDPVLEFPRPRELGNLQETVAYAQKLATFRPGSEFLMIAKGWTALRWATEFEHHGPFILGERDRDFLKGRLAERSPRWDYVNAGWMERYPHALRFLRELRGASTAPMTVLGLVEDGLFEAKIQPSVALLGEMIWTGYALDSCSPNILWIGV